MSDRVSSAGKAVIFDLGNVVLDWNVDTILMSLDFETELRERIRAELFDHQRWIDLDHGKTSEDDVIAEICARTGVAAEFIEAALQAAKHSLLPIEETLLLMQELVERGIDMLCLSNMSRETWAHVQQYEFMDWFRGIVISGIEVRMKPNPDVFLLLLERFELDAQNCLFIDDSLANIETARNLGIDAYHFQRSPACYSELRSRLL